MLQPRIIPALLLNGTDFVKTKKFSKPSYIGDPINTVRIFNELEVDEMIVLDIRKRGLCELDFAFLKEIASECFMPLSYGGGVKTIQQANKIFATGYEKIVINSAALEKKSFISQLAAEFGSQAVVVSVDVKKDFFGKYRIYSKGGPKRTGKHPVSWCKEVAKLGAGEILITSVDRDGTWTGVDRFLLESVVNSVDIPVVYGGGCADKSDIEEAVSFGASGVAVGSMVVYQQKGGGVLLNAPKWNDSDLK